MKTIDIKLIVILFFVSTFFLHCKTKNYRYKNIVAPSEGTELEIENIYVDAELKPILSFEIFRIAMLGFYNIEKLRQKDKIVIIDYSIASDNKRFYVIDLEKKELLYHLLVAHGRNSGEKMATNFSNTPDSKQTSLGFFLTAETYEGKHGLSIRLDGIEKDINHLARKRDIVIHRADYVSANFIAENGKLGRSWGCPALPSEVSDEVIKSIADGRCLFIYGDNSEYLNDSKYLLRD